jgi:hypothetical protein
MNAFTKIAITGIVSAASISAVKAQIFSDSFNYANGDITSVSSGAWVVQNSGSPTIQIANHAAVINQPTLSSPSNERVGHSIGATYSATGPNKAVYASFDATWSSLPVSTTGSYFFNFSVSTANTTTFYGRVGANLNNAAPNTFRVAAANANWSRANAISPAENLSLGVTYKIVVEYDLTTRDTTLWIDPTSQSSASVTATDTPSGTQSDISAVSLRQGVTNTGGGAPGTVTIDDLEVGSSFGAVTPVPESSSYAFAGGLALAGFALLRNGFRK